MKMKKKVSFENNKGKVVKIPGNDTIEDLVEKWGIIDIKIGNRLEPLRDDWWRAKTKNADDKRRPYQ